MKLNTTQLVADMRAAATDVLKKDVGTFRGFSERQLKAIAKQAEFVVIGIQKNEIGEDLQDFFLDGLEDMARSFAETLRGLVLVMIEKVWNAVVGVIWSAISKATNLALPLPDATA